MDPYGKKRAAARYVKERPAWTDPITKEIYDFRTTCDFRLVSIPIIERFPTQGAAEDILVLGVATFAIAGWDRKAQFGNAAGHSGYECDDRPLALPGPRRLLRLRLRVGLSNCRRLPSESPDGEHQRHRQPLCSAPYRNGGVRHASSICSQCRTTKVTLTSSLTAVRARATAQTGWLARYWLRGSNSSTRVAP